jgi:hypothetical protein
MCMVLFDGDRLHGNTLPFYPCCRCISFIRLDMLCLVDIHCVIPRFREDEIEASIRVSMMVKSHV